ncbi:MAG: DUF111 family protein [Smithella sp.]|nr:DUF111 family protein [Smithella sp.]
MKKSKIEQTAKENSIRIFTLLAKAEAKIHGGKINNVHFHEVGAIDSLIDIVGSTLLTMLKNCASGICVVNIDNGYGAGYIASRINRI